MHDKSLLCIQVPNDTNNPIMKKYQVRTGMNFNKTKNFCPPAHLHYFSHTSLTSFMKSSNLRKIVQIGDFPIEMFLLDDSTDYYKNQKFGKYAHKIRCGFNNVIKDLEIQKVLNLGKCLSDLSLGRNIIGFYKKISN